MQKKKFKSVCEPDCPDRSPICHGVCEKYLAEHAKNIDRRKEKQKKALLDNYTIDTVKKRTRKKPVICNYKDRGNEQ